MKKNQGSQNGRPKATQQSEKDYNNLRSPVAKAYRAGAMPVDHRRLFEAIKKVLGDGVMEGEICLEDVLRATGYYRASALKMLQHMQNFGVLESEPRYRATWIKILRDV